MPRFDERYETPKWRTFWLLLGFAVLVGIGVVTVLKPELEDEPAEEPSAENKIVEEAEEDEALQE